MGAARRASGCRWRRGGSGPAFGGGWCTGSMPGERSALQSERLGRARRWLYGRFEGRPSLLAAGNADFWDIDDTPSNKSQILFA